MSTNPKQMAGGRKMRILVVDDNAADRMLLKVYLEQTNDYVVRDEGDAQAALHAGLEFEPDLILLDVMMPGLDGGEVAALFRADATLAAVPIVFLTAAVTRGEVEAGGGHVGEFPFLAKPVVLPELVRCLEQQLRP